MHEDEVTLSEGTAKDMGEGNFMIFQVDEYGTVHSVLMTPRDLQTLLALGMT